MRDRVDLSPYARAALREPIIRALELATRETHVCLNAVGQHPRGPWTVRAWTNGRIVEVRGHDLEGLCFAALELHARGIDTRQAAWRAGTDLLGHGHVGPRPTWTLCGRPAVGERFAHTENARCSACLRALLPESAPTSAMSEETLIAAYGGLPGTPPIE